ncbi:GNAT family N-acetyltransferase [Sediminibacterium sp.]|uniref:GNAT family N-acetyltransferase n=1 Tax=Sediminibacterium sp. TaxID=1917865 RepID=UPI0027329EC7|nr:GNAT family N-acetyltransferase [Sediminibacterium sp.]MDP3394208.1 GNAT family N-acetyltransferase [Sediminibacterium sp.]MDP3566203.1 GNAT family N-acetyltransferase [Sediminibacterium sp.]
MIRIATLDDIPVIQQIAYNTWPSTYGGIISEAQIKYMLDLMYSTESLIQQMAKGHQFYLFEKEQPTTSENEVLGFASVSNESAGVFKLNKLYIVPTAQKTGAGKALLSAVKGYAIQNGGKELILQVNKQNPAIEFYKRQGLSILSENIFELEKGFVMDDYIMGIQL